jgi:hypothetical protein
MRDVIALWLVTMGRRASEAAREWFVQGSRRNGRGLGSVVFKKAKVFNSIKVSHRVPADTAITAP